MKKIAKAAFIIPILFALSGPLFGADEVSDADASPPNTPNRWTWYLSPIINMHIGQANEIVYDTTKVKNQNDYLSLLQWKFVPVFGVGIKLGGESSGRFGFEFEGQSSIAGFSGGTMTDHDWLFTDRDWSHYSLSDISLRWGFIGDLGVNWRIVKRRRVQLRLGVTLHADWWAWTDKLKDSKYSTLKDNKTPRPFDGTKDANGRQDKFRDTNISASHGKNAIDYQVLYTAILATIGMDVTGKVLFVNFRGRVGPALTLDIDNHKLRVNSTTKLPDPIEFKGIIFGGPWVDASLTTGVKFSEAVSFSLRLQYAHLFESKGNTTQKDSSGTSFARNAVGSSFNRFSVGAFVTFSLRWQDGN